VHGIIELIRIWFLGSAKEGIQGVQGVQGVQGTQGLQGIQGIQGAGVRSFL
jgi:hypothetical protein